MFSRLRCPRLWTHTEAKLGGTMMAEVDVQGLRISYDDRGQGEPALLFMPGWCGSRSVFDTLVPRCSAHCRTLAIDWRGHGRSESSPGDFGLGDLVDDALAVIEASGTQSVVPVALAHAGWVAIELRRRLGCYRTAAPAGGAPP